MSIKSAWRVRRRALAALAALPLLSQAQSVQAIISWNPAVQNGSWSVPDNWYGGFVPRSRDIAVTFNDALEHQIVFDGNVTSGTLRIKNNGTGVINFDFPGTGSFNAALDLQNAGNVQINQSGGLVNASTFLFNTGSMSTGTYNLFGGTLTSQQETLGNESGGVVNFIQTGGTHTADTFSLNTSSLSSATYNLSGGTFANQQETLGSQFGGTVNFIQTGGTHIVANAAGTASLLVHGGQWGAISTYLLSEGTLIVDLLGLGDNGETARFIQSGGTIKSRWFADGYGGFSKSYFELNGGTLETGGFSVNSFGSFSQSNGLLHATGQDIPFFGPPPSEFRGIAVFSGGTMQFDKEVFFHGSFTQSGGTQFIGSAASPGTLSVAGSNQILFDLKGGLLQVFGTESIGTAYTPISSSPWVGGTFRQSGGTHTLGSETAPGELRVSGGPRGAALQLTGGLLQVIGIEQIGADGFGVLEQTGGTHLFGTSTTPGTISVGGTEVGWFYLRNGTLIAHGQANVGNGTGASLRQFGGTLDFNGTINIGNLSRAAFSSVGGVGTVGTAYIGGNAAGPGGFGSLLVDTTGDLHIADRLKVWNTGTVHYNGGSLSVGTLDVTSGKVLLSLGANKVLRVKSVSTSSGGIIDLSDNSMVIDYGGSSSLLSLTSPLDTVVDQLGTGIITSVSSSNPNKRIGYSDDGTKITLVLALGGDTNLDGVVNFTDLENLDAHWQTSGYWWQGDFDYNRLVTIEDLYVLAPNWSDSVPFNEALESLGLPQVPEPGCVIISAVLYLSAQRSGIRRKRR